MAKRPTIEERIEELSDLEAGSPDSLARVLKGLGSKTGLVVAAAAEAAQRLGLLGENTTEIENVMAKAFATLSESGPKRDPLCRGKLAIATALHDAGLFVGDVFEAGIGFVQREPTWGGTVDTAADLRARCGLAHAELFAHDAINALARLLADPERNARAGAAHALGNSGRLDAVPLLRFKAVTGDADVDVVSATLRALLTVDPDDSFGFVASLLEPDCDHAEAVALCLGESRQAQAFEVIKTWAIENPAHLEVGYLSIALLRDEKATAFLISEVELGDDPASFAAEEALSAFAHDSDLQGRVAEAKAKRDSESRR